MRLWVTWPDGSGEFERDEVHEVADEAAADAMLRAQPRGWYEATLREADPSHDDGARPTRRRLPRSGWVDARAWPADPHAVPPFDADVRAVADWLRAAGVRLSWPQALRAPWAGRQRGEVCEAVCPDPDATLRSMRRKGHRALDAVVGLVMQDGMERGALIARGRGGIDELRRWLRSAHDEADSLRRELRDARNELRRLKGEPEVSEEQEHAAAIAAIRARIEAATARKAAGGAEVRP